MEQFETLQKYLSGFFAIPPIEWLRIAKLLRFQSLNKGDYYFRQGDPVSEISFVTKGLLYNFYTSSEGEDFVKYFIPEGNMVACYSSLLQKKPAAFSCQALEPTKLISLPYEKLQTLYQSSAVWERIGRISAEKLYMEMEKREQNFLMADAKERYNNFVREKPELVQRVPQYLIASYIGISPVSLSRIRKG